MYSSPRIRPAISIHAPAKGATRHRGAEESQHHFNPRSREGSDVVPRQCGKLQHKHFNPRSREGSDVTSGTVQAALEDFNPRSREGSDSKNHQDYSQ